jgi:hypothetical protein
MRLDQNGMSSLGAVRTRMAACRGYLILLASARHGSKMITIADLVLYRLKCNPEGFWPSLEC